MYLLARQQTGIGCPSGAADAPTSYMGRAGAWLPAVSANDATDDRPQPAPGRPCPGPATLAVARRKRPAVTAVVASEYCVTGGACAPPLPLAAALKRRRSARALPRLQPLLEAGS